MEAPLISIIIPIYNSGKYVHHCIESVLAQTYSNFELILIDDGSTDSSGDICDSFALRDTRIKVFHKENEGASSARNMGIDLAQGQWINFLDSDDYVDVSYLQHLIDHVTESIDLSISFFKNDSEGLTSLSTYKVYSVPLQQLNELIEIPSIPLRTPCVKLYRKTIINNINNRFDDKMNLGEDLVFAYSYYAACRNIQIVPYADYYYNCHEGSLSNSISSFEVAIYNYKKIYESTKILITDCKIDNENAKGKLYQFVIDPINNVLNSIYHNGYNRRERLQKLQTLNLQLYARYHINDDCKTRILRWLLCDLKNLRLYDFIRMLNIRIKRCSLHKQILHKIIC